MVDYGLEITFSATSGSSHRSLPVAAPVFTNFGERSDSSPVTIENDETIALSGPSHFDDAWLRRRREFLLKELAREKETLASVLQEVGHAYHEAVWMITLMIAEFEAELKWIGKVEKERKLRGKAKKPEYASG